MFYDVLQQLCDKINLLQFCSKKLKEDKHRSNALNKIGIKGIKDELSILMTSEDKNAINFENTVRHMKELHPKIKLMMSLKHEFTKV